MVLQQQVDNQRYQPSIKGSVSPSEDNRGGTKVSEKMVSDNGKRERTGCVAIKKGVAESTRKVRGKSCYNMGTLRGMSLDKSIL